MKKITLITLCLSMVWGITCHAQEKTWVRQVLFEKKFTSGGNVFSFVRHMDNKNPSKSVSFYGYFDTARIYDSKGDAIIARRGDSNSLRKNGNEWESAGKIRFTHSHSAVLYHEVLEDGNEYIGVKLSDNGSNLLPNIFKLNKTTNHYEGVEDVKFDSQVNGFAPLGDSKVLIWGQFAYGQDKFQTQGLGGAAIWNMKAGTLNRLYSADNSYGIAGYKGHAVSKKDGTVMVMDRSGYGFKMVHAGSNNWQESYPEVPSGGRFMQAAVVDKNNIYAIWQKDSITDPSYLVRLNGNSWQTLGRFSVSSGKANVNSLTYYNGKVYIIGDYTSLNGTSVTPVVSYNEATGKFTPEFPTLPFTGIGKSRLEIVGDDFYLIQDNAESFLWQHVYMLRDIGAPRASTLAGPTGLQTSSTVTYNGNTTANAFVDLYIKNVKSKTAQADGAGNWSISIDVSGFSDGTYPVFVKARGSNGNESDASQTFFFGIDRTPPGVPLVESPTQNQVIVGLVMIVGRNQEEKSEALISIDQKTVEVVKAGVSSYSWGVTKQLAVGNHTVEIQARDTAGHVSAKVTRSFVVTILTGPPNPPPGSDPQEGKVSLYPNPTRVSSMVTVQNVDKLLGIYSTNGTLVLSMNTTSTQPKTTFVVPNLPTGEYFIQYQQGSNKPQVLKIIIGN